MENKKVFKERQFNLGIVESYKKAEKTNSAILGSFNVKGMTVENMVSQNKTHYSKEVWQQPTAFGRGGKFVDKDGKLKPSTLFGSVDHPIDNRAELLLQEAAIAWHDVKRNDDGSWDGAAHILNNPQGRIVKTFLDYAKEVGGGDLLGVSSRALGEAKLSEAGGEQVEAIVPESFELMSFDFVYNPSFQTAVAHLNESKKSKKTLAESVRNLAYKDIAHADVYKDFANKLDTIDKEIINMNKETIKFEGKSLDKAKENYLRELREQEKKLHDALHELKMMTDEEFTENNDGDRGKLMKAIKKEYDEVNEAIEALENEKAETVELTEDTETNEDETLEIVAESEETEVAEETVEESTDPEPEEAPEAEEAPAEPLEESTEEDAKDNDKEVITEAEDDEEAEDAEEDAEEDAAEELADDLEDELEDAAEDMADELSDEKEEGDLGTLQAEIAELKAIVQELRDFLMPVEDAELEPMEEPMDEEPDMDEEDLEDDLEDAADELNLDLDEEDLDELSDEELEYLANLEL